MATRFHDFVLDGEARILTRGATRLHLSPKALDLLLVLVAQRPRALPKAELLDRVWPGTFVTDASLTRTVHELREVLGAAAEPPVIRTVHGYGYAFGADAVDVDPAAAGGDEEPAGRRATAWLLDGTRAIPLTDPEVIVGRDPSIQVPLPSALVSWHHARLRVGPDAVTLEDLGSKNGTSVGGQRIVAPWTLRDGDAIAIAGTTLVFRLGARPGPTQTAGA